MTSKSADEAVINPFGGSFVPKKKVTTVIGRTSLSLYPDIQPHMSTSERVLAFHINKEAISNARGVPTTTKIHLMGEKHNCSTTVSVEKEQWINTSFDRCKLATNLSILSFHGPDGAIINGWADPVNVGQILPVNALPPVGRPADMMFAKVKADIDLSDLNNNRPVSFQTTFYLRLPMDHYGLIDAAGNNVDIHTFNGPVDWLTVAPDAFRNLIYGHVDAIDDPFALNPPSFNSPEAVICYESKIEEIQDKAMKASYNAIVDIVLQQCCPGAAVDIFSIMSTITQTTKLPNGTDHTMSVQQYHANFNMVLSIFPKGPNITWDSNPFRRFVEGLDPDIKSQMERDNYRRHQGQVSLEPRNQLTLITEALQAASAAEKATAQNRQFIQKQMADAVGMATQVVDPTLTLTSAAEQAIKKYSSDDRACWGCGGKDHGYYDRKSKTITCPHSSNPAVRANAEKKRKEFIESKKKSTSRRKGNSGTFTKKQQAMLAAEIKDKKILAAILGKTKEERKEKEDDDRKIWSFPTSVLQVSGKDQLPIQIHNGLPTIKVALGTKTSDFNPLLPVMVDSGSAITCGSSNFIMKIAETYPELVASITLAKDRYNPIVLAGVVSDDGSTQRYTMNLPAVVEFHMPYGTQDGDPTTIKIAVGKDVSVNCLAGVAFIKAAKLIIDLHDDIVESKVLATDPFPIKYVQPKRTQPNILPREGAIDPSLTAMQANITQARKFIDSYDHGPLDYQPTSPGNKCTSVLNRDQLEQPGSVSSLLGEPKQKRLRFNDDSQTEIKEKDTDGQYEIRENISDTINSPIMNNTSSNIAGKY